MNEWVDVAIKVAFPILSGVSGWAFMQLRDHDQRLRTLEATVQTKDKAAQDLAVVNAGLSEIRVTLARIEERLNTKQTRMLPQDGGQ